MSLDTLFVTKLLDEDSGMEAVSEAGIIAEMLFDDGGRAFEFIVKHNRKYGNVPDRKTITIETGIDNDILFCEEPKEPFRYYIDQILERHLGNLVGDKIREATQYLARGKPKDAVERVKNLVHSVNDMRKDGSEGLVDLTKNVADRWDAYEKAVNLSASGRILGAVTPWDRLNEATWGIQKGQFWLVLGRSDIGKSWLATIMASCCWKNGERVLLVTAELAVQVMSARFDAVSSGVPYMNLRRGILNGETGKARFIDYLDDIQNRHSIWIAGNGRIRTVADLDILINEINPTIVFVDGLYLLHPSRSFGKKYDRVSGVADEISPLAQRLEIPIVGTSQFNMKQTKEGEKGKSDAVNYASELFQNARVVIGIHRDDDLRANRLATVYMMKNNDGEIMEDLLIKFDFVNMDFSATTLDETMADNGEEEQWYNR